MINLTTNRSRRGIRVGGDQSHGPTAECVAGDDSVPSGGGRRDNEAVVAVGGGPAESVAAALARCVAQGGAGIS